MQLYICINEYFYLHLEH